MDEYYGIVSDTPINEHSLKIEKLEEKIEELEEKIKSLEEDSSGDFNTLNDRMDDFEDEVDSKLHLKCIPFKWRIESEEDENSHPLNYESLKKQEGGKLPDECSSTFHMLWGLTKMDKQIELLEENYNGIQKEQLCSCKTQELLEEKINKLETEVIYNQHIMISMFNDIYTKMFPSLFNTIDSMNENLEDYGMDTTNLASEFNTIKKSISDNGIEEYVDNKCINYIDDRDKRNIRKKLDEFKTLKELTNLALKQGFKQEEIDNAIEKGNSGLTILKEKRNAHTNLYELLYIKHLKKSIDTRILGLPISDVGPIFNRNLKHLDKKYYIKKTSLL